MNRYHHENVKHNDQLPAMIAILDAKLVKKYFPTDIFVPSHWHRSLEISLIENIEVFVRIGDKETCVINDFTCINSGVVHSLRAGEIHDDSSCIILLISYEFIKYYYPDIDSCSFDLSLHKDHTSLKQLYYRLRDLYQQQNDYTYLSMTACVLEILNILLTSYQIPTFHTEKKSVRKQNQIKEVLTFIHTHYQEDISLQDLADLFHVSKEYFSRQFHRYVGKTFRDYLADYRLYKAYEDVIHSDLTIQEIALRHGFSNVRSFIKLFSETYHDTPMRYRIKCQENDMNSSI